MTLRRSRLHFTSRIASSLITTAVLWGCNRSTPTLRQDVAAVPTVVDAAEGPLDAATDDRALLAKYECNRCHDGTGLPAPPMSQQCVGCHQSIAARTFSATSTLLTKWDRNIVHLRQVPSLLGIGARYKRDWVEAYLQDPYDQRPHVGASMPRLAYAKGEAARLARVLVPHDEPGGLARTANAERGRALIESARCGQCHTATFSPQLRDQPSVAEPRLLRRGVALAPDLRFVREKWRPAALIAWLTDPKRIKADTDMPKPDLSESDTQDVAAYLIRGELAPRNRAAAPERLPVLTRQVSFAEVERRVLKKTCWHCHSDPDFALGDGGPGNTGGFGFRAIALNLSTHEGIMSGALDEAGQRASIFRMTNGSPRIIAALMARHSEDAGSPVSNVRGMPLGLPPLALEEIQLVETWVTQGRHSDR